MPTLPQAEPLTRRLQVNLTDDALRRIKQAAAAKDLPVGRLISDWAQSNLPAVVEVAA